MWLKFVKLTTIKGKFMVGDKFILKINFGKEDILL